MQIDPETGKVYFENYNSPIITDKLKQSFEEMKIKENVGIETAVEPPNGYAVVINTAGCKVNTFQALEICANIGGGFALNIPGGYNFHGSRCTGDFFFPLFTGYFCFLDFNSRFF